MSVTCRGVQSAIALLLLLAGAVTAAANLWGVRPINARLQAQVGPQIAHLIGRDVRLACPSLHDHMCMSSAVMIQKSWQLVGGCQSL